MPKKSDCPGHESTEGPAGVSTYCDGSCERNAARAIAARARFDAAMEIVERAQHDLEAAARMLCPINGQLPAWEKVGKEADRVHRLWEHLAYKRRNLKMSLDHDPDATDGHEVARALGYRTDAGETLDEASERVATVGAGR